jgi:hypothetical protein
MGLRVHSVFIKEIACLLLICQALPRLQVRLVNRALYKLRSHLRLRKYILLAESHVLYIKRLLALLPTLYRI